MLVNERLKKKKKNIYYDMKLTIDLDTKNKTRGETIWSRAFKSVPNKCRIVDSGTKMQES